MPRIISSDCNSATTSAAKYKPERIVPLIPLTCTKPLINLTRRAVPIAGETAPPNLATLTRFTLSFLITRALTRYAMPITIAAIRIAYTIGKKIA